MLGYLESGIQSIRKTTVGAILLLAPLVDAGAQVDPNALAESARQAMAQQRFAEAAEIYAGLASKFPNEPTLQANL